MNLFPPPGGKIPQGPYYLACPLLALLRSCPTLRPHGPTRLLCPWDSPGNTGVGCHALLQGIVPTQGLNLHLLTSPALAGKFFTASATWGGGGVPEQAESVSGKLQRDFGLFWWLSGNKSACSAGDPGSVSGWGRSHGEGNGNPL